MDPGYATPRHFQRSARPSISGSPRPSAVSPLVRAQWPWVSAGLERPSSAMSSPSTNAASQWDASSSSLQSQTWRAPTKSAPQLMPSTATGAEILQEDHGITQWHLSAFEWMVPNVRELRKFIENQSMASAASSLHSDDSHVSQSSGIPAVLRETPVVGDGRFKLEIGKPSVDESSTRTASVGDQSQSEGSPVNISVVTHPTPSTTLSLCLTALQLDYDPNYEIGMTIMAAIKSNPDFPGQRGARAEWVWETWEGWIFRKGSEFWECNLPSLTSLLENPRIAASDSLTISIQLHSPLGPQFPQQPSAYYVPKDLLDGLEASLDNPNTGDVQFICLERFDHPTHGGTEAEASTSNSASSSSSPAPMARKRILYAHADILTRRSDYFATLISSSFQESANVDRDRGRLIHTIVVEEADFVTVYWLLKYLYCNHLLFREDDDPRAAVDGIGAGWSARWLTQSNEWEWKTFSGTTGQFEDTIDDDSTAKSVASDSLSVGTGSIVSNTTSAGKTAGVVSPMPPMSNRTSSRSGITTSMRPSSNTERRTTKLPVVTTALPPSTGATSARPSSSSRTSPSHSQQHGHYYPVSPSQARPSSGRHQPDPHVHPTPAPKSASALSVYQLAHRYNLSGLQHLALDHMMSTISPRKAFPLLLATCFWSELNGLVQDYTVEHWQEVSGSTEFECCCLEVAAGEWGPEGGQVLTSLFRRLHAGAQAR